MNNVTPPINENTRRTSFRRNSVAIISASEGCEEPISGSIDEVNISDWEDGILTINSILIPGTLVFDALSENQKTGLFKVQQMLLKGDADKAKHVPVQLNSTKGSKRDVYNDYILSEYAGIKKLSRPKPRLSTIVNASIFITRINLSLADKKDSYEPEEWTILAPDTKRKLARLLSWDSFSKWTFDIFELNKLTDGKALLFMGWAILCSPNAQNTMEASLATEGVPSPSVDREGYCFIENLNISQCTLCNFLRSIELDYNDNPYHNNIHGADVMQSVHSILTGIDKENFSISELESFSILLAAAIHDVNHPGRNNSFQINKRTDHAVIHNNRSVLENMHLASAFSRIIGSKKDENLNFFEFMSEDQFIICRALCIDAVLHTDMSQHFSLLTQMKKLHMRKKAKSEKMTGSEILPFILHMADISNPSRLLPMAVKWTDRCLQEFFEQGDEEKQLGLPVSPLCCRIETKRAESQIGFIKYVVQPSYIFLGGMIPKVAEEFCPIIESNLEFWCNEANKLK